MKISLLLILFLLFSGISAHAQKKLTANVDKSKIQWRGERVLSEQNGTVNLKSGWLTMDSNKITGGEFIIDMTTIEENQDTKKLEAHLRSDDFFAVDKYPESKLVIKQSGPFEKNTARIKGDLTIRGKTNPVDFSTVMQQKDDGLWFFSKVIFDRSLYDVKYGSGKFFENLGDKIIYDEIEIRVSLNLSEQQQ